MSSTGAKQLATFVLLAGVAGVVRINPRSTLISSERLGTFACSPIFG